MTKGKKIALTLVIVLVLVVVALAIIIPMIFNIDRYRPRVIAQIQQATGKPAHIGHLALSIFLGACAFCSHDWPSRSSTREKASTTSRGSKARDPTGAPSQDFSIASKVHAIVIQLY